MPQQAFVPLLNQCPNCYSHTPCNCCLDCIRATELLRERGHRIRALEGLFRRVLAEKGPLPESLRALAAQAVETPWRFPLPSGEKAL